MPNRALELDDLATPIVTSSSRPCVVRPRRCLTPRKYCRFLDDPYYYYYPCAPRCTSSSPYRRRVRECHTGVSKRGLKSGRVVCDTFSTVCYPRNMASYCGYRNPRRPYSCSPKRCYRSCTPPILCENGICRGACKCRPGTPPRCPRSPCSPMGDTVCERDPPGNFVDAMNAIGPLSSRYEPHMCPWEADVTVSGTIKAHCTSTADEISERLAGPFKAVGRRYTTDSEYNWDTRDSRAQKLTLGELDDGAVLDFSKNNRPTMPDNLDYRVRRIMNSPTEYRKTRPSYHKTKGGHIHWDKHLNDDDFYDTDRRYSPRPRQSKYRDEDDKRHDLFSTRSQNYDGFEIIKNRKQSTTGKRQEPQYYQHGRYLSTSDTEREDNSYRNIRGISREWPRWHDTITDDDDVDDDYERDRRYARDTYKSSRKYAGADTKVNNYGDDYYHSRYSSSRSGDREKEIERPYRDNYEGDTRWTRRHSDRKEEESDRKIRFWPR